MAYPVVVKQCMLENGWNMYDMIDMSGNHVEYHGDDILNWGESTSSFVCRTIVLKEHITSEWGRIHCWLCQRIDNETVAREHQSCWLVD